MNPFAIVLLFFHCGRNGVEKLNIDNMMMMRMLTCVVHSILGGSILIKTVTVMMM